MLPEYDWQTIGETAPLMGIHKSTGDLYWNAKCHQKLGYPVAVVLAYDEEANSIRVVSGFDYAVAMDDAGRYYISALSALTECGLVFPLANHITGEPTHVINNNSLIFSLGE